MLFNKEHPRIWVEDNFRVGDKKPDKREAGHCNKLGDRSLGENQEPQIHSCRCFLRLRQGAMDRRAKDSPPICTGSQMSQMSSTYLLFSWLCGQLKDLGLAGVACELTKMQSFPITGFLSHCELCWPCPSHRGDPPSR